MAEVSARSAARLGLDAAALLGMVQAIAEHLQPMAGTLEVLARLQARRSQPVGAGTESAPSHLYYLSNMPQPYARTLEARHDFLQWFDGGVFSGDVHHIKPEPAIYQLLQDRYALAPTQTVFIDDLAHNVQAAQALGWHGIHFESAPQLQAQLAQLGC